MAQGQGEGPLVTPPDNLVVVHNGGDALLVVNNLAGHVGKVGIRVSSVVLCMVSDVFLTLLSNPNVAHVRQTPGQNVDPMKLVSLRDDDGDAMHILLNILHLYNNLPTALPPRLVYGVACLAAKYQCNKAVARSTWPWFDHFHKQTRAPKSNPAEIFTMVESALLLDEPVLFRRMTDMWVLEHPIPAPFHVATDKYLVTRLGKELKAQQVKVIGLLREDFDRLVDCCILCFTDHRKHYVDHEPGVVPDEDLNGQPLPKIRCLVDPEAAQLYLGALRNNGLWPTNVWPTKVGEVVRGVAKFQIPEYDDGERCAYCKDVGGEFERGLALMQRLHRKIRCWGLCLDCFKRGGMEGQCRLEHPSGVEGFFEIGEV